MTDPVVPDDLSTLVSGPAVLATSLESMRAALVDQVSASWADGYATGLSAFVAAVKAIPDYHYVEQLGLAVQIAEAMLEQGLAEVEGYRSDRRGL